MGWRYPAPYDFYDPPEATDIDYYVRQFLDPDLMFHAVLDDHDRFVGFCSYGRDGQVKGGDYTLDALDIGVGMRPDLTGQGIGAAFFEAILHFADEHVKAGRKRVTVAKFNERALRLYRRFGFHEHDEFEEPRSGVSYKILVSES